MTESTGPKISWAMTEELQVSLAGGLRRVLQDHGAAGEQRGRDLVADQADRRVPGDDRADHADRLAEQAELPDRWLGGLFEGERAGQRGEGAEGALRADAAAAGDRGQHPGLARPDLADVFRALLQLSADRPQVLGPLLVRQPRPRAAVERLAGRLDGPRDIGGLCLGNGEVELLGVGVDDADLGVGRGGHPLAADVEAVSVADRRGCLAHAVPSRHGPAGTHRVRARKTY
jgi:hypothetical protein